LSIARRDLQATYVSAFGVGMTAGFAALGGVLLVIALRGDQARLDTWFAPLFVALGVLAALVNTRTFADEERSGSLELLLTAPVNAWQVALGKLLGAAGVLAVAAATTLACPLLVARMGEPDAGPIVTGYVGLGLVGLAFLAAGMAVSASTSNPLVASAGTVAILVALWLAGVVGDGVHGRARVVLQYLSPASHVTGFLRGTLAIADIVYFVSVMAAGVSGAAIVVRARR
jgi:ABC-2 type transport system permease protein